VIRLLTWLAIACVIAVIAYDPSKEGS